MCLDVGREQFPDSSHCRKAKQGRASRRSAVSYLLFSFSHHTITAAVIAAAAVVSYLFITSVVPFRLLISTDS
jgi:hypothetical protein